MGADRIYAAYLTGRPDPQRGVRVAADDFSYMQAWHRSIERLGLRAVVVHDRLSDAFVERHRTPEITFHRVDPGPWTTNDARFFAYHDHLRRDPAERVFLTDLSDVVVVRDPFEVLDSLEVDLVVGDEDYPPPIGPTIGRHRWLLQHIEATRTGVTDEVAAYFSGGRLLLPTLNAGVIGGCYAPVLELLERFVSLREQIGAPERNLNMPLVNYLIHHDFDGRFHHGPPITSRFKRLEGWRTDVAFVHK